LFSFLFLQEFNSKASIAEAKDGETSQAIGIEEKIKGTISEWGGHKFEAKCNMNSGSCEY